MVAAYVLVSQSWLRRITPGEVTYGLIDDVYRYSIKARFEK